MSKGNNDNNMLQAPLLSLVMPFYNNPLLVGKMIDSILDNTFTDWELLAVDDGSSEETLCYLERYKGDKRIKIISREVLPKGAQTCRNVGFEHASGEYIIFVDSDDYLTPSCLETRVAAIIDNKDCDFMVFPSGVVLNDRFIPDAAENIYGYDVYGNDLKSFARRELPFIVWSNIYRASSLKRSGIIWDTELLSLQDADYNVRSILAGLKYKYVRTSPDYGYRISQNDGSVSKNIMSEKHFRSHLHASRKMFENYQKCFGHKYDKYVFQGVLRLYNNIFTNEVKNDMALDMVSVVKQYNGLYGMLFSLQVHLTFALSSVLPAKTARQIPMAFYLLCFEWRKRKCRKRIVVVQ